MTIGARDAMTLNLVGWDTSRRAGGTSGSGCTRWPRRGGRLNGAVALGVILGWDPGVGAAVSTRLGRIINASPPTITVVGLVMSAPSSASTCSPAITVPFV